MTSTSPTALCVDLDGTLVATDCLWESVLLLTKQRPKALAHLPGWLLAGRAALKTGLADRVLPDAATLPYRQEVLDYVKQAKTDGRPVYLVTASEQRIAQAVGAHLGLFEESIGSEGGRNLKGSQKAAYLEQRFGRGQFDYVGDSSSDAPVWAASRKAVVVSNGAVGAAKSANSDVEVISVKTRPVAKAVFKAVRLHQWAKNVLLFLAPILAHLRDLDTYLRSAAAFLAFGLVASSVYILNDLLDLEQDRRHRTKRNRPFASGNLSIPAGLLLSPLLLVAGLGISLTLPPLFTVALFGYQALTTLYSVYLKRKLIVDVLTLAALFTYRVLAGGFATGVGVSFWLLAFSMFFFTCLAFVKRYSELVAVQADALERIPGRNYWVADLDIVKGVGPASGLMAVMVFCLYIHSPEVQANYASPRVLWLVAPVLLYWITRVWFLAARDQLHDDPVVFALSDRISYLAGVVTLVFVALASLGVPDVLRFW